MANPGRRRKPEQLPDRARRVSVPPPQPARVPLSPSAYGGGPQTFRPPPPSVDKAVEIGQASNSVRSPSPVPPLRLPRQISSPPPKRVRPEVGAGLAAEPRRASPSGRPSPVLPGGGKPASMEIGKQGPPVAEPFYSAPAPAPAESDYRTLDNARVRLSPLIDPLRQPTELGLRVVQRTLPKPLTGVVVVALGALLAGGAASWWALDWMTSRPAAKDTAAAGNDELVSVQVSSSPMVKKTVLEMGEPPGTSAMGRAGLETEHAVPAKAAATGAALTQTALTQTAAPKPRKPETTPASVERRGNAKPRSPITQSLRGAPTRPLSRRPKRVGRPAAPKVGASQTKSGQSAASSSASTSSPRSWVAPRKREVWVE